MATTAESGSGEVLRSERIAAGILPKVLNTFDMVAIFVAIVLFISNSAVMAGGAGPAAYIYWGLGFITFLIPGAIVTGQLGLMCHTKLRQHCLRSLRRRYSPHRSRRPALAWAPGSSRLLAARLVSQLGQRHLLWHRHPGSPRY